MRMLLLLGVPVVTTTAYSIARAHDPQHSEASVSLVFTLSLSLSLSLSFSLCVSLSLSVIVSSVRLGSCSCILFFYWNLELVRTCVVYLSSLLSSSSAVFVSFSVHSSFDRDTLLLRCLCYHTVEVLTAHVTNIHWNILAVWFWAVLVFFELFMCPLCTAYPLTQTDMKLPMTIVSILRLCVRCPLFECRLFNHHSL